MSAPPSDDELRDRGLASLERDLGRAGALRFLALLSHEPFDYQQWRDAELGPLSLSELLEQLRATPR